mgnify:CR=1 FL=1
MDAHLRRKLGQGLKPLVNTHDVGERKSLLTAIEAFIQRDRVELHVVGGGFELHTTYDFFELYTRVALEGCKSFCTEEDIAIALVALKAGYFIQWFAIHDALPRVRLLFYLREAQPCRNRNWTQR